MGDAICFLEGIFERLAMLTSMPSCSWTYAFSNAVSVSFGSGEERMKIRLIVTPRESSNRLVER